MLSARPAAHCALMKLSSLPSPNIGNSNSRDLGGDDGNFMASSHARMFVSELGRLLCEFRHRSALKVL
jgi:hypothetical protein